ncbi:hypothetical protein RUND412_008340 [Rhizina undulata]
MSTAAPLPVVNALQSPLSEKHFLPSGDVSADLNFFIPPEDGSAPYNYVETPPPNTPRHNLKDDVRTVKIHDLRGKESSFSLDIAAFQPLTNIPTALYYADFENEEKITSTYYDEIREILKSSVPGIKEVVIFDHTIRRNIPNAKRTPVSRVHIDQTPKSGRVRLYQHLPKSKAEEVEATGTRYRIINVWRPLKGPVIDFPLGFADSSTVDEEDVVGVKHIHPNYEGETAAVKWNDRQKRWYWSGMQTDEVVLIKCIDSDTVVGGGKEGKRGRAPHSAFAHPGTPAGAEGRESIEVRCLVLG